MNTRNLLLPLGNAVLFLSACVLISSGLLLELRMDEKDGAVLLFGMNSDDWGEIHFLTALGFSALTAIHLLLNRAWIKSAINKTKWSLPVLAGGACLAAALLLWPTDHPTTPTDKKTEHCQKDDD